MSDASTQPKRRGLAISQALTRVLLMAGCERTGFALVIGAVAGLGMIAWQDWSILAALGALLFGCAGLPLLRRMARHDPMWWKVYTRNRRYARFYPARSTPFRAN